MQRLSCYDEDAAEIEQICEEKDITEPELISGLLDAIRSGELDIDDWV